MHPETLRGAHAIVLQKVAPKQDGKIIGILPPLLTEIGASFPPVSFFVPVNKTAPARGSDGGRIVLNLRHLLRFKALTRP